LAPIGTVQEQHLCDYQAGGLFSDRPTSKAPYTRKEKEEAIMKWFESKSEILTLVLTTITIALLLIAFARG
jgi:hypothetical protein